MSAASGASSERSSSPPPGAEKQRTGPRKPAKLLGCLFCAKRKRRCHRIDDSATCQECRTRGLDCEQPDPSMVGRDWLAVGRRAVVTSKQSRRQRERAEKAHRRMSKGQAGSAKDRRDAGPAGTHAATDAAQNTSAFPLLAFPGAAHGSAAAWPSHVVHVPYAPLDSFRMSGSLAGQYPPFPLPHYPPMAPQHVAYYPPNYSPYYPPQTAFTPSSSQPFVPPPMPLAPLSPSFPLSSSFSSSFFPLSPSFTDSPKPLTRPVSETTLATSAGTNSDSDGSSLRSMSDVVREFMLGPGGVTNKGKMGLSTLVDYDDPPPPDLLVAALTSYWNTCYMWSPFIHRSTFLSALNSPTPCPIYRRSPLALYYAVASLGLSESGLNGITDFDRIRWGKYCSDRAKEELQTEYFARATEDPGRMTPLEAIQATLCILPYNVAGGNVPGGLALMGQVQDALMELCFDSEGAWKPVGEGVQAWIEDEMRVRTFLSFFQGDVTFAYYLKRNPWVDYRAVVFRMPCHERFFDAGDAGEAYEKMRGEAVERLRGVKGGPVAFNLGQLLDGEEEERARVLQELVHGVFDGHVSTVAISVVATALRVARIELRSLREAAGIDVYRLAARITPEMMAPGLFAATPGTTDAEAEYLRRTQVVEQVLVNFLSFLPEGVGSALTEGDVVPLFSSGERYFGEKNCACTVLVALCAMHSARLQNWIDDDLVVTAEFATDTSAGSPYSFLSSPCFLSVLDSGVVFIRLLSSHMRYDPELKGVHMGFLMGILNAGALSLAGWKISSQKSPGQNIREQYAEDVAVVNRYLERMGSRFRPYGEQFATIFQKLVTAAGIERIPRGTE